LKSEIHNFMRRIFTDPAAPHRDAIEEAATWIRDGGVVAIPTDTLYGLAVDPFNRSAVARLFDVKRRAPDRAVALIAADRAQVETHFGALDPLALRLAERFWPGPLTLLVAAPPALAEGIAGDSRRVGVRVPADAIARGVCAAAERPITATSANISGDDATADPDAVERTLGAAIDVLLDAGRTPGGPPSTIVDTLDGAPRVIRAGAIAWDEISAWLQQHA
jgi:L-threonylcarbamoyladenylate synthase